MVGVFHHCSRRQYRVARPENPGNSARTVIPPIHHRGVHLLRSCRSEDAALSGIEQGVVLERHHRLGHCVERATA
jgi:hypothetical protein